MTAEVARVMREVVAWADGQPYEPSASRLLSMVAERLGAPGIPVTQILPQALAEERGRIIGELEALRAAPTAPNGSPERGWQLGYNKALADAVQIIRGLGDYIVTPPPHAPHGPAESGGPR